MNRNLGLRKCRASWPTWKTCCEDFATNTDAPGSWARAKKYHALRVRAQSWRSGSVKRPMPRGPAAQMASSGSRVGRSRGSPAPREGGSRPPGRPPTRLPGRRSRCCSGRRRTGGRRSCSPDRGWRRARTRAPLRRPGAERSCVRVHVRRPSAWWTGPGTRHPAGRFRHSDAGGACRGGRQGPAFQSGRESLASGDDASLDERRDAGSRAQAPVQRLDGLAVRRSSSRREAVLAMGGRCMRGHRRVKPGSFLPVKSSTKRRRIFPPNGVWFQLCRVG